jgi:hypothetical protein
MIKHGKGVPGQEKPYCFYIPSNPRRQEDRDAVMRSALVTVADDLCRAADDAYMLRCQLKAKRAEQRMRSLRFRALACQYLAFREGRHD